MIAHPLWPAAALDAISKILIPAREGEVGTRFEQIHGACAVHVFLMISEAIVWVDAEPGLGGVRRLRGCCL